MLTPRRQVRSALFAQKMGEAIRIMRAPEAAGIATLWETADLGHGVWEQIAVIQHDAFWPRWRERKHDMSGHGWRVEREGREWVVRLFTNEDQVQHFASTGKVAWFHTEGLAKARPAEPMSAEAYERQDKQWMKQVHDESTRHPNPLDTGK